MKLKIENRKLIVVWNFQRMWYDCAIWLFALL